MDASILSMARSSQNYKAALVMTHSHSLDYDCRILLRRPDLHTGLIGSESKSRRFRKAQKDGLHDLELARLTSLIGKQGLKTEPGVIAMSVLSEILTVCQRAQDRRPSFATSTTPLNQVHHG